MTKPAAPQPASSPGRHSTVEGRRMTPSALLTRYARLFETARTTGLPLIGGTIDYTRVVNRIERVLYRASIGDESCTLERDIVELERIAGEFREYFREAK